MAAGMDQNDPMEMGERMGKFMGSFMREMKDPQERLDSGEGWRGVPRMREPADSRRSGWGDYDAGGRRGEPREGTRYMPLYDPWGVTNRGSPLPESELWGSSPSYYGRSHYPGYGNPWNDPGSYGWAANRDWDRGRGYYGAGLTPWEAYELPPDPRAERRWYDPSYYEAPSYGPGYRLPGDEPSAPPRAGNPWQYGSHRGGWW
ncbi:MAG: hypothetical protein H7834_11765 [Magnetococcus sp. YQC-9]